MTYHIPFKWFCFLSDCLNETGNESIVCPPSSNRWCSAPAARRTIRTLTYKGEQLNRHWLCVSFWISQMSRYRTHLKEQSSERTSEYKGIQITVGHIGGWIIRYISLASTQVRDHDMCSTMMDLKSTLYNIQCIAFAGRPTHVVTSVYCLKSTIDRCNVIQHSQKVDSAYKAYRAHRHAMH